MHPSGFCSVMNSSKIYSIMERAGVIKKGHFLLSSGLHSDTYLQCALLFVDPENGDKISEYMAQEIKDNFLDIDYVVAPAMGGMIIGYEVAKKLGVKSFFCEKENGLFKLRRGFSLPKESKVLIVEDVVTTGGSVKKVIDCVGKQNIVGVCSIIDRRDGEETNEICGFKFISLLKVSVAKYPEDNLPEELKKIPLYKPGSG